MQKKVSTLLNMYLAMQKNCYLSVILSYSFDSANKNKNNFVQDREQELIDKLLMLQILRTCSSKYAKSIQISNETLQNITGKYEKLL